MNARTQILARISAALRKPSIKPPPASTKPIFTPIAESDLYTKFESELLKLKGQSFRCPNWEEAQSNLNQIVETNSFLNVVHSPHVDCIQAVQKISSTALKNIDASTLAQAGLGISICECLVARTGSAVITTHSGFGRTLSILPPAHLIIARRSQLVGDLNDAYTLLQKKYSSDWPSMISIITGASRTSDIEKILVLGAHGPKKLFILFLDF
jgi:L-lactate dehydrogenase complex protein LldG